MSDIDQVFEELQKFESGLIRVADVAALLDVSVRSVWRMDKSGKLPAPVTVGVAAKRWRKSEILAWIGSGCPDRETWESQQD